MPSIIGGVFMSKKKGKVRESKRPPHPSMLDKKIKDSVSPIDCLTPKSFRPDCSSSIIFAHSISRSGSLSKIARDNHVYSMEPSINEISKNNGLLPPKLIGWKLASTFPGFCSKHDSMLFSCVENRPFQSQEIQIFRLAYRSLAVELYRKHWAKSASNIRGSLASHKGAGAILFHNMALALEIDGENDLLRYKRVFDLALENNEVVPMRSLVIEFDGVFPVQCSTAFTPSNDIDGERIQEIDFGVECSLAFLNSFYSNNKSYILLSWLARDDEVVGKLARSIELKDGGSLPSLLASYIFCVTDGVCISPDWYDSLIDGVKSKIINMLTPCLFNLERFRDLSDHIGKIDGVCLRKMERVIF